ncbi:ADP-ribosylglycohydrolase family protein [bacterium]|jgi:ADP-ribosylglycohydrolase|nr:ADP-ribosylglycohydrolase family protein [bacterium]MBT5015102.1 ADP-ribosylglycohydrolase family protein [bacterium]
MNKHFNIFFIVFFTVGSVLAQPDLESRYQGSVLASAIGDAMGKVTEFKSMDQIHAYYPHGLQNFDQFTPQDWIHFNGTPWEDDKGNRFAPFTDDTQMAIMVLETLVSCPSNSWRFLKKQGGIPLDLFMWSIAYKFNNWYLDPDGGQSFDRAPGNACKRGCEVLMKRVEPEHIKICPLPRSWDVGATNAGGCGSVMHAFPFGLVLAHDLDLCEFLAVEHSKLSHGHSWALAACGAMAVGVAEIINQKSVNEVLDAMVITARKHDSQTADLIEWAREQAFNKVDSAIVFDRLRSWTAHEAIAAAAYIFAVSSDDIVKAIRLGVNTPGDSDSIAAMAGALVGARCGIEAIPNDWIKTVEQSQELQDLAKKIIPAL